MDTFKKCLIVAVCASPIVMGAAGFLGIAAALLGIW